MHFSFVVAVVLVCLSVGCNGQFKILGLLDTKSEVMDNGQVENVENIRALVNEELPAVAVELSDSEIVKASSESDVGVKEENLNFIKPYESVTTESRRDLVRPEDVKNSTTANDVFISNKESSKNVNGVVGETILENAATSESSSTKSSTTSSTKSSTTSSTTIKPTRTYGKALHQPNIRKFSYLEARNFHQPDSPNHVTPSSRWTSQDSQKQFVKVLKHRNKYKSKCRCERISNCPKIQISIQRCEPDYFMCCF